MTRDDFEQAAMDGHVFTVEFIKRTTGEYRVMNCRCGVKKDLKGVGRLFDPKKKDLLGVWDMQNDGYRFVNLKDLQLLKMKGKCYRWNGIAERFDEIPAYELMAMRKERQEHDV